MTISETTRAWLKEYVGLSPNCKYGEERDNSIKFAGIQQIEIAMAQWRRTCLQNANLIWQVGGAFVQKFPFAATVLCPPFQCPVHTSDSQQVFYAGTLPQFALERISTAIMYGLSTITIHAFEQLPTKQRIVPYRDPVLICWEEVPQITQIVRGEGLSRTFTTYATAGGIGYVLAAWDYDKEIPLPQKESVHYLD